MNKPCIGAFMHYRLKQLANGAGNYTAEQREALCMGYSLAMLHAAEWCNCPPCQDGLQNFKNSTKDIQ